jgi:hypothetical protein
MRYGLEKLGLAETNISGIRELSLNEYTCNYKGKPNNKRQSPMSVCNS